MNTRQIINVAVCATITAFIAGSMPLSLAAVPDIMQTVNSEAVSAGAQPDSTAGALTSGLEPSVDDGSRRSAIQRLNRFRKNMPKLYLPYQLVIGESQQITVQGPPNQTIRLYLSPNGRGFITDDGLLLRVGKEREVVEATTNEQGVAKLDITLPNESTLDGHVLFIDGSVVSQAADGSETNQQLQWLDPSGQKTTENRVVMSLPSDGQGATVLPGLPGMGGDMLRRLGTMQDIRKGGDRVKALVDDGSRSDESVFDRNVFVARPDGTGGVGN